MAIALNAQNENKIVDPEFLVKGKLSDGVTIKDIIKKKKKEKLADGVRVDSTLITRLPAFSKCKRIKALAKQKKCLNQNIQMLTAKKFNVGLFSNAPSGKHRVYCFFKISKEGKIIEIEAYARYRKDEQEATRMLSDFPVLRPGEVQGEPVNIYYTLPISFYVE